MTILQIVFLLVSAITVISAIMVVSAKKIMHSALWLILTLLGVAILFALLESRFFVVVQVIVYIGAIAILIIFAVMLTRGVMKDEKAQHNKNWWLPALIAVVLFFSVVVITLSWDQSGQTTRAVSEGGENLQELGEALVDPSGFLIPFEVASVLLLAAMIGAIYLAKDRKEGERS